MTPAKPAARRYPGKATTHNVAVLTYLTPEQKRALDALHDETRIPKTVLLREAVDDLLRKYKRRGGVR